MGYQSAAYFMYIRFILANMIAQINNVHNHSPRQVHVHLIQYTFTKKPKESQNVCMMKQKYEIHHIISNK